VPLSCNNDKRGVLALGGGHPAAGTAQPGGSAITFFLSRLWRSAVRALLVLALASTTGTSVRLTAAQAGQGLRATTFPASHEQGATNGGCSTAATHCCAQHLPGRAVCAATCCVRASIAAGGYVVGP